jgi:hypothetical protein
MDLENIKKLSIFNRLLKEYSKDLDSLQSHAVDTFAILYSNSYFNDFWFYAFLQKLDEIDNERK